jgi:hypothetical protein
MVRGWDWRRTSRRWTGTGGYCGTWVGDEMVNAALVRGGYATRRRTRRTKHQEMLWSYGRHGSRAALSLPSPTPVPLGGAGVRVLRQRQLLFSAHQQQLREDLPLPVSNTTMTRLSTRRMSYGFA